MKTYKIALIPGDGIGREVIPEGVKVLQEASKIDGNFKLEIVEFLWNSDFYFKYGQMMPDDALAILKEFDAIYLGAVGHPRVPDYISVELVLKIRQRFNQYVNLRPIKLLPGIKSPVNKFPEEIDILFVRENTEGEYTNLGGIFKVDSVDETATQTNIFTRKGTERIMNYAFKLAESRSCHLTSVTKSNALKHSMVFWDKVFSEIEIKYPQVNTRKILVDAMAMFMVLKPEIFDVVVSTNLFGDILTDLGAALQGGLGFAPGGNINPEKEYPSMFEPIHGSAPDITGKGIANPIAAIWAGKMLLDHLGETKAADRVFTAIEKACSAGKVKTPDMGGTNTTTEMTEAVLTEL